MPVHLPLHRGKRAGYLRSFGFLMGHVLSTGLFFVTWYFAVWLVSLGVDALNEIHAIHATIYQAMTSVEKWLVYLDICACLVFFVVGLWRLCRDFLKE